MGSMNKTNVRKGREGKIIRQWRVANGQIPQQRWDTERKVWVKL